MITHLSQDPTRLSKEQKEKEERVDHYTQQIQIKQQQQRSKQQHQSLEANLKLMKLQSRKPEKYWDILIQEFQKRHKFKPKKEPGPEGGDSDQENDKNEDINFNWDPKMALIE